MTTTRRNNDRRRRVLYCAQQSEGTRKFSSRSQRVSQASRSTPAHGFVCGTRSTTTTRTLVLTGANPNANLCNRGKLLGSDHRFSGCAAIHCTDVAPVSLSGRDCSALATGSSRQLWSLVPLLLARGHRGSVVDDLSTPALSDRRLLRALSIMASGAHHVCDRECGRRRFLGFVDGKLAGSRIWKRVALVGADWIRLLVSIGGGILALRMIAEIYRYRIALAGVLDWNWVHTDPRSRRMESICCQFALSCCGSAISNHRVWVGLGGYLRSLHREVCEVEASPTLRERIGKLNLGILRKEQVDDLEEQDPQQEAEVENR